MKGFVKCHAKNRKVFLGPGCEGHGAMKGGDCEKNNDTKPVLAW